MLNAYNITDSDPRDFPSFVGANVSVSNPYQNNLVGVLHALFNTNTHIHTHTHTHTHERILMLPLLYSIVLILSFL